MILGIGPADAEVAARLAEFGPYVEVGVDEPEAIAEHLSSAVGIAARAAATVDAATIAAAPRLRVIGRSGVGVERVDVAAATARDIPVVITPNAGTRAVAEGAFALILHLVKRLGPLTELVRAGAWDEREQVPLGDLDGAVLGIVGLGRIGRRVAQLGRAFGMTVLAYDPLLDPATIEPDVALTDLGTLLSGADVVSLHAPLTETTERLIDATALAGVKRGAVLVNCARGGLLDLDAVHAALWDGRLAGLGLDVYDPEPPIPHPVFTHPAVVLTPHVMALSARARRLVFAEMADGMAEVLAGRRAASVANPDVYEHDEVTTP